MQERVDVTEAPRFALFGDNVQVRPVEGDTEELRATVPVKALIDPTVIVEVPVLPAIAVTDVGLAVTEKSGTATL